MPQSRKKKIVCNADVLQRCVNKILSPNLSFQGEFADGCTWTPVTLIATALFWVWSDEATLVSRFHRARKITMKAFRLQTELSSAYQPFIRMLVRWSDQLTAALIAKLRASMQTSQHFLEQGFAVLAADGSRFEVPRTQSNERYFSPHDQNGKRKRRRPNRRRTEGDLKKTSSPQVWITTVWHIGCGLPWSWRHGESGSSERAHLRDMLSELPDRALITADAGFAGYDYWKAMLGVGCHFVIRVGANVKLLKQLGYARESGNRVYLWTERAAAKDHPPLVLRILALNNGRHPVYLVTSVLSASRLSDSQLAKIYARRWGVELFYRHAKQTFDMRKLRSRKAANVSIELDWSMLGLWAVCWLAHLEDPQLPPRELSVAKVLRAIRTIMREYKCSPDEGEEWHTLLREARIDSYRRKSKKTSRNYPRKKTRREAIAKPVIQHASKLQRSHAANIKAAQG